MKRARILVAVVLALTACGGPRTPLNVGVREINTDVLIGPQGPTPRATLPPLALPPSGFPGFVQPPVIPPGGSSPTPPPPFCPRAHPFAAVKIPTTTVAHEPPVPARYTYKERGTWTIGARTGSFPPLSSRTIANVVEPADGGGYTFDITIPGAAGERTTTTYHTYPTQPDPLSPQAGIYIERVSTVLSDGTETVFEPVPSLLLMPFPASIDARWDARGVDPTRQIVMQYTGHIARRGIVDACGTKLEAWVVDVTEGVIRSTNSDLRFSARLFIAPQYGGLSLMDTVERSGSEDGKEVQIVDTARITREPERPR